MSEPSASALEDRNALVEKHRRLATAIAVSFHRRFPNRYDLDDLVQIGVLGLISAAARYKPWRGVPFQTFARHRIRGAILDALRRRHAKSLEDEDDVADVRAGPDEIAEMRERSDAVDRAIEHLPPRQARVIELRYGEGLTQAAAGERLGGISQAGARALELRAIQRLRRSLRPAA